MDYLKDLEVENNRKLPQLINDFNSTDLEVVLKGLNEILLILQSDMMVPVRFEIIINSGMLTKMVTLLDSSTPKDIQQAACSFFLQFLVEHPENITHVAQSGALFPLIKLIEMSDNPMTTGCSSWVISQLVVDENGREEFYNSSALDIFIDYLKKNTSYYDIAVIINNLTKGTLPSFNNCLKLLEILALCLTTELSGTLELAVPSLKEFCKQKEFFHYIVEKGIIKRVLELTNVENLDVSIEALLVLELISSGNEQQIQHLQSIGTIPVLKNILTSLEIEKTDIAKRIISNLVEKNSDVIQEFIDFDYFPLLISLLDQDRSIIKILSSVINNATKKQIEYFVLLKFITIFLNHLDDELINIENHVKTNIIESIYKILLVGDEIQQESNLKNNPYSSLLRNIDGYYRIERIGGIDHELISNILKYK